MNNSQEKREWDKITDHRARGKSLIEIVKLSVVTKAQFLEKSKVIYLASIISISHIKPHAVKKSQIDN